MPTYHNGEDMWDVLDQADLFLITTCASLNRKGELIMGAGIAMEAKERWPKLPQIFGRLVRQLASDRNHDGPYGMIICYGLNPPTRIGAFQTKHDWRNPSEIALIAYSIAQLEQWIYSDRHDGGPLGTDHYIALPFPGIGNGGLPREQVKPWIDLLPNNVHVFER